jgi:hypothetical protein
MLKMMIDYIVIMVSVSFCVFMGLMWWDNRATLRQLRVIRVAVDRERRRTCKSCGKPNTNKPDLDFIEAIVDELGPDDD